MYRECCPGVSERNLSDAEGANENLHTGAVKDDHHLRWRISRHHDDGRVGAFKKSIASAIDMYELLKLHHRTTGNGSRTPRTFVSTPV